MAGKKPDYRVSAIVRGDDQMKGTIGVAWKSDKDDGRISIRLNTFVVLKGHPDLFITLFPIEDDNQSNGGRSGGSGSRRSGGSSGRGSKSDMDEEIPF